MKTLVFLAGMVPFQNTNARKNVYFFKYRDNSGQRIKSELGRKFSRIQRRVRTLYALLAHRGIGRFIIFDSGASSMLLKFLAFFTPSLIELSMSAITLLSIPSWKHCQKEKNWAMSYGHTTKPTVCSMILNSILKCWIEAYFRIF